MQTTSYQNLTEKLSWLKERRDRIQRYSQEEMNTINILNKEIQLISHELCLKSLV